MIMIQWSLIIEEFIILWYYYDPPFIYELWIMNMSIVLSEEQICEFQLNGVVVIPNIIEEKELIAAR